MTNLDILGEEACEKHPDQAPPSMDGKDLQWIVLEDDIGLLLQEVDTRGRYYAKNNSAPDGNLVAKGQRQVRDIESEAVRT